MNKLEDTLIVVVPVVFLLLAALLFAVLWFHPALLTGVRLSFPDLQ